MGDSRKNTLSNLKKTWHKIDGLYDFYAKSVGLNFASIIILQLLSDSGETYTQKDLGEKLGLPKQFVNSVITSFWERGFVELMQARDRRNKEIIITDDGREYAAKILKPLEEAERAAWGCFSDEELAQLVDTLNRYTNAFNEAMKDPRE